MVFCVVADVFAFPPRRRENEVWEPWVSGAVIARHYNVSTRTVRRWRALGMPSRMVGGARRFRLSDVERWHAERSASCAQRRRCFRLWPLPIA
jgi:Helix-turn-helix domain